MALAATRNSDTSRKIAPRAVAGRTEGRGGFLVGPGLAEKALLTEWDGGGATSWLAAHVVLFIHTLSDTYFVSVRKRRGGRRRPSGLFFAAALRDVAVERRAAEAASSKNSRWRGSKDTAPSVVALLLGTTTAAPEETRPAKGHSRAQVTGPL